MKNIYLNKMLIIFFIGYVFASISEGIFTQIPLYVKQFNGSILSAGYIISMGTFGSLLSAIWYYFYGYKINPAYLTSSGCLIYLFGEIAFITINKVDWLGYVAGGILGVGAGLTIIAASILIIELSRMKRLTYVLSIVAGLGVLGYGMAPLLVKICGNLLLSYQSIISISLILSASAGILFFYIGFCFKKVASVTYSLNFTKLKYLFSKRVLLLLFLSFLMAGIFSSLVNFQSSYAEHNSIDYKLFYFCYFFSVVISRFAIVSVIKEKHEYLIIAMSFIATLLTIIFFGRHPVNIPYYVIFSVVMGVSYGVSFPLLQSQLVRSVDIVASKRIILIFCFVYFIALFGLPAISGLAISFYSYSGYFFLMAILASLGVFISLYYWLLNAIRISI